MSTGRFRPASTYGEAFASAEAFVAEVEAMPDSEHKEEVLAVAKANVEGLATALTPADGERDGTEEA